ncbi:hypothetical protein H641_08180 [Cutibacterium granulosum DSM 20700]|uniref:Uncharacterized protein n=1 Tax=Cutibacterium granulosum DSM 20700 TaxID=1160719 RepID=U1GF05_9ACTN|nr:hypothetical protein H641_08180 [Cutibacterium granulosum DSM 20700]
MSTNLTIDGDTSTTHHPCPRCHGTGVEPRSHA